MNAQFKKGALELCVLVLLLHKDHYGYELVRQISEDIDIARGTLYPLLKKMQKDQYLSTYFVSSTEGPQRKYYAITYLGKERMESLLQEWMHFSESVTRILQKNCVLSKGEEGF
ncbi:PadR family transcriptional regulator [Paenibacillus wulumuqiensis]|uniref:PadR family transcriptional regulator n=1 Tax=Paenibacillus wulumuqiensis TaxID=1567107 RepID=UPI0009E58559|nr:PadR family transcriptional regulator [Paenibacillus wulumuqiensis]